MNLTDEQLAEALRMAPLPEAFFAPLVARIEEIEQRRAEAPAALRKALLPLLAELGVNDAERVAEVLARHARPIFEAMASMGHSDGVSP